MTGDNLRVGFFTEDAHYVTAETSVDAGVMDGLSGLDPVYEDDRGLVFEYDDARTVLRDEIDDAAVKQDIREEFPHLLAYLNGELQECLEENYGDNGVLIAENWPEQVEERLERGEYSLDDFDLGEAMVAVTHGEDPDDLRRSYMRDSFWDRHENVARKVS